MPRLHVVTPNVIILHVLRYLGYGQGNDGGNPEDAPPPLSWKARAVDFLLNPMEVDLGR
jgi:hypothetical protein